MNVFAALVWQATLRKAAALEQWLVNHRHCSPAPALQFADDNMFETGHCSCGESLSLTVVIDVVPLVSRK